MNLAKIWDSEMLTCIPCSKQLNNGSLQHPEDDNDGVVATPRTKQALKALTAQVIITVSPEANRVSALCSFLIEFLFIFRSRIWH